MSTCPMCAEDITTHDAVCPHCGHVLRVVSPSIQVSPASAHATVTARSPRARFGVQYVVPLVLTLATLVAVVVWLALRRKDAPAWWCLEEHGAGGVCLRDHQNCETIRQVLVTGNPGRWSASSCVGTATAWCPVLPPGVDSSNGPGCYGTQSSCVAHRRHDRPHDRAAGFEECVETGRPSVAPPSQADAAVAAPIVSASRSPNAGSPVAPRPPSSQAPSAAEDEAPALGPEEPEPTDENFPESSGALRPQAVSASSFIRNPVHPHGPEQAFDGDLGTAWNEGTRGPGDGEWIEADLGASHRIERVAFTTGWDYSSARHGDLFPLNSHIRHVRVTFDGRHPIERDVGFDERQLVLDGLHVRARSVRIEAVTVWPGTRWSDLSIAEVVLAGRPTGHAEGRTQPLVAAPPTSGDASPVVAASPTSGDAPNPAQGVGGILVPNVASETALEPPPRPGEGSSAPPPQPREEPPEAAVEPRSVMPGWPCHADLECMGGGFCSRAQGGLCSHRCESVSDCTSGLCLRGECWRPCQATPCEGARCVTAQDDNGSAVQVCRR